MKRNKTLLEVRASILELEKEHVELMKRVRMVERTIASRNMDAEEILRECGAPYMIRSASALRPGDRVLFNGELRTVEITHPEPVSDLVDVSFDGDKSSYSCNATSIMYVVK